MRWFLGLLGGAMILGGAAAPEPARQARSPLIEEIPHSLPQGVSIGLPADWVEQGEGEPPSPLLTGSAPPMRFERKLNLESAAKRSLLQIGVSNNIFLGRDSYWLDQQLHSANNSGLSLADFLFYFFFPPPASCLAASTDAYAGAGRASVENGGEPDIEVYLDCKFAPTTADFYSSQIGPGVILRQTEGGLRAIGVVNDFYRAPMEETSFSGMTFFIFEARQPEGISPETAQQFRLPQEFVGRQSDFFWAVGSKTPFPFVNDANAKDARLIHVAYATLTKAGGAHDDFVGLLHGVHSR